jgi:ribose transport system ATP-binding protein
MTSPDPARMSDRDPALVVDGLSKTFQGQRALVDLDLELRAGEVHALVGQNGSGKSTLIKILSGYHQPDPGSNASVGGQALKLGDPDSAYELGLRFVHQDLGLALSLSALDNLALGRGYRKGRFGLISWSAEQAAAADALSELGYRFPLRAPVSTLTASERTGIAIARALEGWSGNAKVLVLDEPTASLPGAESERFLEVVRKVRDSGVAVLFVSHRFAEVLDIADRVSVLRDGVRVVSRDSVGLSEGELIALTLGRAQDALASAHEIPHVSRPDEVRLSAKGITGVTLEDFDLEVHAGEIVGVAGVTGSGREEVANLVFGAAPRGGDVIVGGEQLPPNRPDLSLARGVALVPADRHDRAAFLDMNLTTNMTISELGAFTVRGNLSRALERAEAQRWLERLDVVPCDPGVPLANLSGGNQQKVILARALRLRPDVLVLDEPTQGVDVGAKAAIHATIEEAAAAGAGVLVVSTESDELVSLCDRVLVLLDGKVAHHLTTQHLTGDELTDLTMRKA